MILNNTGKREDKDSMKNTCMTSPNIEMKRIDDPDMPPVNLGFVECPVCGYGCEGFFLNNTGYPQQENEEGFFDSMDDYCEHLRYVKKDLAYFLKSN